MLDEHDQLAVIRGLQAGSRDAWTALYDGYSTDVWRYVGRLVANHGTDVADVVQETFLAAACSAQQYDAGRGSLWSWLAGIAHHQSAIHWRRSHMAGRLRTLAEARAVELSQWWKGTESADDLWQRQELAELVREVLAELPDDYAVLLTAKYLDEQSLEAMAGQFGGSVEAMKSKLARAREFRDTFESRTREPTPARVVRDAQA